MANINNLNTNDQLPAFIRREDDTECHVVAVWNAPRAVRSYVSLADPTQPADADEARDVFEVCVMTGRPVPARAAQLLQYRPPNVRRRRLFATQPMSESKRNCRNYGYARDRVCNANNQRWALMCHGTHALDAHLASQHGIPASGIVPYLREHEDMEAEILNLRQQLGATTGGTANAAANQNVANLQQQLHTANNQLTAATTERDAARTDAANANAQVATLTTERDNANNQLTTANAQLSRVQVELVGARAEVARLRAVEGGIRANLCAHITHLIQTSPTLQAASGMDPNALALEIVGAIDLDRIVGTVTPNRDGNDETQESQTGDGGVSRNLFSV